MNMFYNADLARTVKEITNFDDLIARVDKDPSVLVTLSLKELKKINCYYDEIIRQKKAQIRALEGSSPSSDQ